MTLTCPRALQSNGSVWWQPEGRVPGWASGRRELRDTSLVLPAVRPEDSGRYGCRAGGRLLHTVHLLVDGECGPLSASPVRSGCVAGAAPAAGGPDSQRLRLAEPPEPPRVSCSRRSHQKDILCEWQPRARPSPSTRAVLWVKRCGEGCGAGEGHRVCPGPGSGLTPRLSPQGPGGQRHGAAVPLLPAGAPVRVPDPDAARGRRQAAARLGVREQRRRQRGQRRPALLGQQRPYVRPTPTPPPPPAPAEPPAPPPQPTRPSRPAVKPDPPVNLTVDPVEAAPQQLRLSWTYPPSWDASFYQLRFQVRYRAEPSGAYAQVSPGARSCGAVWAAPPSPVPGASRLTARRLQVDGLKDTSLVIRDALRGARHWVQVRAREEFDLGEWSEWSREAVGSPWAGKSGQGGPVPPGSWEPLAPGPARGVHRSPLADPREQEAITAWDEGLYGAGGSLLPELLGSADAEDVNSKESAGVVPTAGARGGWCPREPGPGSADPDPRPAPASAPSPPSPRSARARARRPLGRVPVHAAGGRGQPAAGRRPLHRHRAQVRRAPGRGRRGAPHLSSILAPSLPRPSPAPDRRSAPRYRRRWRKEPRGRGKPGTEALPAEPPPSPSSPLSDVPLLLPLASPGPYDVANMDYFFTPRAW